jgi:hypothetical protein
MHTKIRERGGGADPQKQIVHCENWRMMKVRISLHCKKTVSDFPKLGRGKFPTLFYS